MKKRKLIIFALATFISTTSFSQSTQQQCHQEFQECSSAALSYDNIQKVCDILLEQEKLKCSELIGQDQIVCLSDFENNKFSFIRSCISAYESRPLSLGRLASGCRINYNRCIESSSSR